VLAEAWPRAFPKEDLKKPGTHERDDAGNIRLSELNLGDGFEEGHQQAAHRSGREQPTLGVQDIGYENRCADPIPFDMEYTRDLGYARPSFSSRAATRPWCRLQAGQTSCPIPLPRCWIRTGRTRLRMVDTRSTRYAIARRSHDPSAAR